MSYNSKNNEDSVSVMNSGLGGNCLVTDSSGNIKNDLDSYNVGGINRVNNYRSDLAVSQNVMLETHWNDNEASITPNDMSYAHDSMLKYSSQLSSSRIGSNRLTDRERLQLHNELSWKEASEQDIIIVRCREMSAELHKCRLGSGSKGKCLKMGEAWLTPSEFESISGRGSSKDWKRSIRFGGHTLQKLIEEGILAPHAIACTCSICCGESHLGSGPVRLFTPYKRKRKDMNGSLATGCAGSSFSQIEEVVSAMYTASQNLKVMLEQLRIHYDTYRDSAINQIRVQSELEKREALLQQRTEIIAILRRVLPVEHEGIVQQIIQQFQTESSNIKSCSNCGRDAFLECTACRRACYCSTYCQQRDWPLHQHHCALVQNTESMVASSNLQVQGDDSQENPNTPPDDNVNNDC